MAQNKKEKRAVVYMAMTVQLVFWDAMPVLFRDVTSFHRDILTESHGVTSQNTVIVILIALRTTKNTAPKLPFPKRQEIY